MVLNIYMLVMMLVFFLVFLLVLELARLFDVRNQLFVDAIIL